MIRFYRLPGVDQPSPLLVSDSPIESPSCCPLCGAERTVEFQLIATLLAFLNDDDLQFDSVLIYTCNDNCDLSSHRGWAQELVIQQAYSDKGVSFGQQAA